MNVNVKTANEYYRTACNYEASGSLDLAEVYYLKSAATYEQVGDVQYVNAANALNGLAVLRVGRSNLKGALCAAKRALLLAEKCPSHTADIEVVRYTAWELIQQLTQIDTLIHQFV